MRGAQFKRSQSSEDRRRNLLLNGTAGKSSWERLWWSWVWRVDLIWTLEAGGGRNHLCEWVCRTLLKANQDPGFPKASCWLSPETLPATYLPAPVLTLSSWSSDEGWWSRSHSCSVRLMSPLSSFWLITRELRKLPTSSFFHLLILHCIFSKYWMNYSKMLKMLSLRLTTHRSPHPLPLDQCYFSSLFLSISRSSLLLTPLDRLTPYNLPDWAPVLPLLLTQAGLCTPLPVPLNITIAHNHNTLNYVCIWTCVLCSVSPCILSSLRTAILYCPIIVHML